MWILSLIVLLCLSTEIHAQVLVDSVVVDFSITSPTFYPPNQPNRTCNVLKTLYNYQVLTFPSLQGFYEVVAVSSGNFHIGVYEDDSWDRSYPCDYYKPLRRSFRSYDAFAPPVDDLVWIDYDTAVVVFTLAPQHTQKIVVSIYSTAAAIDPGSSKHMNETYFDNTAPQQQTCQVTKVIVPYVTYSWTQANGGLYDIYGTFESNIGFSLGLYSGNSVDAASPCSAFIAGSNSGQLGSAIYGVSLQQASNYTLVVSGSGVDWSYYELILQVAKSKILSNLKTGFIPPATTVSDCEPSAVLNNTYWYSFETDNIIYPGNFIYALMTATDEWSIFAYAGINIGNGSTPPQTCPPSGLIASSGNGSVPLFVTIYPKQVYTFVISSSQNAADATDTQPFLYFLPGALPITPSTTSTTGPFVSTTSKITTGNSTSTHTATTSRTTYYTIAPPATTTSTSYHTIFVTSSASVVNPASLAFLVACVVFIA